MYITFLYSIKYAISYFTVIYVYTVIYAYNHIFLWYQYITVLLISLCYCSNILHISIWLAATDTYRTPRWRQPVSSSSLNIVKYCLSSYETTSSATWLQCTTAVCCKPAASGTLLIQCRRNPPELNPSLPQTAVSSLVTSEFAMVYWSCPIFYLGNNEAKDLVSRSKLPVTFFGWPQGPSCMQSCLKGCNYWRYRYDQLCDSPRRLNLILIYLYTRNYLLG